MKIVFATNNKHKLEEIKDILGKEFEIVSLAEIGCHEDIPETGKLTGWRRMHVRSLLMSLNTMVRTVLLMIQDLRWRHSGVNPACIQLVMQRELTTIARRICVSCWQT